MKKILVAMLFLSVFMVVSCDGGTNQNTGPCSGSFPNSHAGLCWSDRAPNPMNWDDAMDYCQNLGGRLPTISELRTLIQNCPGTETGGDCEVTDSCLSSEDCWNNPCSGCEYDSSGKYSVFGDTNFFWSSSERSDGTGYAWDVGFSVGDVDVSSKYLSNYVRCVR